MTTPDRPDAPAPESSPAGDSSSPRESFEVQAEIDALFALVQRRYGSRLTPEELEGVRKGVQGVVEGARALRAVRLGNADEPFQPFATFRSDA